MKHKYAQPWVKTSVNISPKLYKLARQHFIKFSEAMRVGIAVILGDKGVVEYDNELNVVRKMRAYKKMVEDNGN